jgi:hypothetical protein
VKIYKILFGVPPVSNSETALLMPFGDTLDETYLIPYDILSRGGVNYTTMFNFDYNFLSKSTIIIPSDLWDDTIERALSNSDTQKRRLIVLNTDGYGSLAKSFFESKNEVALSLMDSKGAYIHLLGNYSNQLTAVTKYPSFDSVEFILDSDNTLEENDLKVIDDEQTNFWNCYATGVGTIKTPTLTDDHAEKIKGNSSLKINVEDGEKSIWWISHAFSPPADWSSMDFISFYWHGMNSGYSFSILLWSSSNYFVYTFHDDWSGWKQIIVPFSKFTKVGEPSLHKIDYIDIKAQPNARGIWNLDCISLSAGKWTDIEVKVNGLEKTTLSLSIYNGTSYLPIDTAFNSWKEVPRANIYYLDGSSGDEVYNSMSIARVYSEGFNNTGRLIFSVKLPPDDGCDSENTGISQLRLKISWLPQEMRFSKIIGTDFQVNLPMDVNAILISPKEDVKILSWFSSNQIDVPFTLCKKIESNEIIYVNIYPLVKSLSFSERMRRDFYLILENLINLICVGLQKYDVNTIPWVMDDDIPVFYFKGARFNGNISVSSTFISFLNVTNIGIIRLLTETGNLSLSDVISMSVENLKHVDISATEIATEKGMGFYAKLSINQPLITVSGDSISLFIRCKNGTSLIIRDKNDIKLSTENRLLVLLREPYIQINGVGLFETAFACHSYLTDLGTLGQDLTIQGHIEFRLSLADEYSYASGFNWNGRVDSTGKFVFDWDILGSLVKSIPWIVFASLLFFITLCLWSSKNCAYQFGMVDAVNKIVKEQ